MNLSAISGTTFTMLIALPRHRDVIPPSSNMCLTTDANRKLFVREPYTCNMNEWIIQIIEITELL